MLWALIIVGLVAVGVVNHWYSTRRWRAQCSVAQREADYWEDRYCDMRDRAFGLGPPHRRLTAEDVRETPEGRPQPRCRFCGETSCDFYTPRCDEAQQEHRKALANGMPPSGRHG